MLAGRATSATVGRTRTCPHCKATILESAAICPQCKHHLKFGAAAVAAQARPGVSAFKVEGTLQHAAAGDWGVPLSQHPQGARNVPAVVKSALHPSSRGFAVR
jgi:hypothetical protein